MTTAEQRNIKYIRAYLSAKLAFDCFESISEFNVYVDGLDGRDFRGYPMEKPYVYSQSEDLINLDTATDDDLLSVESMNLLYAVRGKEVLIYRWTDRKYNEWKKMMGDRLQYID
tara:strand:+ start:170 stop:511 length:342 start_codon:yes stop_codon:yes gene_type:complete